MHAEISPDEPAGPSAGFFLTIAQIPKEEKLTVKTTFTLQPYNTSKTGTFLLSLNEITCGFFFDVRDRYNDLLF